jgi:hypothetical protein
MTPEILLINMTMKDPKSSMGIAGNCFEKVGSIGKMNLSRRELKEVNKL